MKLQARLLLLLLLLGWAPLALFAWISDQNTRNGLVERVEQRMADVRDLKALQIEEYMRQISLYTETLSQTPLVVEAMQQLPQAFQQITAEQARNHYIYNNPNSLNQLGRLIDAKDGSDYSQIHRKIHPFLHRFIHDFEFYDLFLIDLKGNIIYSADKESDFATNVEQMGATRHHLRALYQQLCDCDGGNQVELSPVTPYLPTALEPAGFIASPIESAEGASLGVLVLQYTMAPINRVINNRQGIHPSSKVLLIQEDKEDESRYVFLNDVGMSWKEKAQLESFHQKMAQSKNGLAPVVRALRGEIGSEYIANTPRGAIFAAWRPVTEQNWGLVIRANETAILAEANQDRRQVIVALVLLLLLILVAAWLQSRQLIHPIHRLLQGVQQVGRQQFQLQLNTHRSDELGDLNRAVVQMGEDLQRITQSAENEKRRYQTLFNEASDAIFIMSGNRLIDCNQMTLQIFGCGDKEDIIGHTPSAFSPEYQPDGGSSAKTAEKLIQATYAGVPQQFEWQHRRLDGSLFDAEVGLNRIEVDNKVYLQTIVRDITARKQIELSLQQAKEAAEKASQTKDDFLASMSHELRTPLTAIIGNSEFLAEQVVDPEQREIVCAIEMAGRGQLALVNDILDMSKIESGKFAIEEAPYELARLLSDLKHMLDTRAKDAGLELVIRQRKAEHNLLLGDVQRIGQILINLISNAIKFTEQGRVELTTWNDGHYLFFRVEDSGIGMTPGTLDHLFQRFEQADNTISRRFGGSGLGLFISDSLAELMGGNRSDPSSLG